MFIDVCPGCGGYRTGRDVHPQAGESLCVCRACGHAFPFLRLPLTLVLGASGCGKTALCLMMPRLSKEYLFLEGDLLLQPGAFDGDWGHFRALWLQLAVGLSQGGRPVVLFMGGMPEDFLSLEAAKFFSQLRFIGLIADPREQRRRLLARPAWRGSGGEDFLTAMEAYNQALSALPVTLDTTGQSLEESGAALLALLGESFYV